MQTGPKGGVSGFWRYWNLTHHSVGDGLISLLAHNGKHNLVDYRFDMWSEIGLNLAIWFVTLMLPRFHI